MHVERCFYHAYLVITERHAESYTHAVEVLEDRKPERKIMDERLNASPYCLPFTKPCLFTYPGL